MFLTLVSLVILFLWIFYMASTELQYADKQEDRRFVKSRVQCAGGNHDLEEVTYDIIAPVKTPTDGVLAVKGRAAREECKNCIYAAVFGALSDKENLRELNLTPGEYDTFVSKREVFILKEDSDVLVEEEEVR